MSVIAFIIGCIFGYLVYDALAQYQDYKNLQYLDRELADYYEENNQDD